MNYPHSLLSSNFAQTIGELMLAADGAGRRDEGRAQSNEPITTTPRARVEGVRDMIRAALKTADRPIDVYEIVRRIGRPEVTRYKVQTNIPGMPRVERTGERYHYKYRLVDVAA